MNIPSIRTLLPLSAPRPQFGASKVVPEITDATFEQEVLNSPIPVLLKFGAPWCGPCNMLDPELDKIATDPKYQGKLKVVKINIDNNQVQALNYRVSSIPVTILFTKKNATDAQNSVAVNQLGYVKKDKLAKLIDPKIGV